MTLASIGVNTTLALASGIVGAYISSKADPFLTISGGLAGIISVGAGLDLYSPAIDILIAFIGAYTMPFVGKALEKAGIDDAVGAFAVHGYCGMLGAMAVGVMATGYPQGDRSLSLALSGSWWVRQFVQFCWASFPGMGSALSSRSSTCCVSLKPRRLRGWI